MARGHQDLLEMWADFQTTFPTQKLSTPLRWEQVCCDWPNRDYYQALELPPGASAEEIKHQFRLLSRRCHPDKHEGKSSQNVATATFQLMNEAVQVLRDPAERDMYDWIRLYSTTKSVREKWTQSFKSGDVFQCRLCNRKFRGVEFIDKHLFSSHEQLFTIEQPRSAPAQTQKPAQQSSGECMFFASLLLHGRTAFECREVVQAVRAGSEHIDPPLEQARSASSTASVQTKETVEQSSGEHTFFASFLLHGRSEFECQGIAQALHATLASRGLDSTWQFIASQVSDEVHKARELFAPLFQSRSTAELQSCAEALRKACMHPAREPTPASTPAANRECSEVREEIPPCKPAPKRMPRSGAAVQHKVVSDQDSARSQHLKAGARKAVKRLMEEKKVLRQTMRTRARGSVAKVPMRGSVARASAQGSVLKVCMRGWPWIG
eukprot:TRINITY_DN93486_c0_g1_i1.p1 TRINITY_DN93486_c0_g1~~TRINITY_DN93486_c0_g1_i1.p1  ORF type:complete len:437 (+),score=87.31 TRINITY_DN93486_c0_g1_i1:55-1365(+)